MANHCDFYEYKSSFFSGGHWCVLKDKEISSDVYKQFCEYASSAKNCPFRRKDSSSDCFLTTACVVAKNLPDDCYELKTLRGFRDSYIKGLPNGEEIIKEYYNIAPKIIEAIEAEGNSTAIINQLYDKLVIPCVQYIEDDKKDEAYELYTMTVVTLKEKYLM